MNVLQNELKSRTEEFYNKLANISEIYPTVDDHSGPIEERIELHKLRHQEKSSAIYGLLQKEIDYMKTISDDKGTNKTKKQKSPNNSDLLDKPYSQIDSESLKPILNSRNSNSSSLHPKSLGKKLNDKKNVNQFYIKIMNSFDQYEGAKIMKEVSLEKRTK